jgi:hypothetical protein
VSDHLGGPPLPKECVCPLLASLTGSTFLHIYRKCLCIVVEKMLSITQHVQELSQYRPCTAGYNVPYLAFATSVAYQFERPYV